MKITTAQIESAIGKTLDYSLPATAMSQYQCNNLSKQFESVALPKSAGIVHTTDKESIRGYEIKDLYKKTIFIPYTVSY